MSLVLVLLLVPALLAQKNTYTLGNVRVTMHTAALFRLEWSASATFDDRPTLAFINRGVGPPQYHRSTLGQSFNITTSQLSLSYSGPGKFSGQTLSISFPLGNGTTMRWTPDGPGTTKCGTVAGQDRWDCGIASPTPATCAAAGCCYDTNNVTNGDGPLTRCYRPVVGGTANLLGSVDTMDCDLGVEGCINWYRRQLNQGLVSRDGWVLVDDSANPALDSSNFNSGVPWRVDRPWTPNYQDWYFFGHGHNYKQALYDFQLISGPINLMDVHGYGVWHSRYHKYSAQAYTEVVEKYAALHLPLNVAVLDMDWHIEPNSQGCDPYGGYVWNTTLFPDPASFTAWLHSRNLKTIVNTHDVTGIDHCQGTVYDEAAVALGINPSSNTNVQCRIQNSTYTGVLYDVALNPLMNGSTSWVDWFWTDWGKDDGVWYRCIEDTAAQPMLWSNYIHCQMNQIAGKRGLVLTPYGGLGNHRYPQVGSGDTDVAYATLAFEVYSTLTAANVLTPWTHDLGGFHQTAYIWPTSELWLRWVQFGVFSPSFRTHCTHQGACEPWDFLHQPEWTAAFQLRNALVPYIYSASFESYNTGVAISHPLYYDWPEAAEAYSVTEQYLFGDAMMVAPVIQIQSVPRNVWIPPGEWYTWQTLPGARHVGPTWLRDRIYTLGEIPVFVRAGSIIPTKTMADYVVPPVAPRTTVFVAFPGTAGAAQVYEDAGEGIAYQQGAYRIMDVTQSRNASAYEFTIAPNVAGKGYPGEPVSRAYTVQFLGSMGTPKSVSANGVAITRQREGVVPGWWIENVSGFTTVTVALASTAATSSVVVAVVL